ncbi:MAG: hypothetical protein O7H39_15450 [Gammaproteobacteria bacterium]|nr:hypothetical protein [Gammaproteobacteria bacterium]
MNHKELCKLVADGDLRALKNGVKSSVDAALHWKPIMDAAFAGRPDMVGALIDAGADPNVVSGTPARTRRSCA